jgi:hypothetical protein
MKVALIGATGFVGKHLLTELLNRNHQVTAIVRDPKKVTTQHKHLAVLEGDVFNEAAFAAQLAGHDAVISAYNPGWANPNIYDDSIAGFIAIQAATKKAGVQRFISIGGAGSLYVAPGVQLVDTEHFPKEYYAGASAARDYLNILKEEKNLDWTFVSPAIEMHPGTAGIRRGTYRTALENPVFDENGRSILSVEDLAVAITDELENPKYIQQRFTAAY